MTTCRKTLKTSQLTKYVKYWEKLDLGRYPNILKI